MRLSRIFLCLLCCALLIGGMEALPASAAPRQTPSDQALIAAIDQGDAARALALLAAGADPNTLTASDGNSALVHALLQGSTPVTVALLAKGAQVDGDDGAEFTPLTAAVFTKGLPVAKLILEHGANVNLGSVLAGTPLELAAGMGQIEIMQLLVDKGAKIDPASPGFPLASAAEKGETAAVEFLLAHGARVNRVNSAGQTALILAASRGNLEIVQALLAHGARVDTLDASGATALEQARGAHRVEIIAALRQAGAKEPGPTLFKAVRQDDVRMLLDLLEQGADPNEQDGDGRTPLFYAGSGMNLSTMEDLLKKGANPNAHDKNGKTPLDVAREAKQTDAILQLLAAGADAPEFALNEAVLKHNVKAAMALLDAKASPNKQGLLGQTPLTSACKIDDLEMVRLLTDRGANVNTPDTDGWTPLMLATSHNNIALARFLLEKGADVASTIENGTSALMCVNGPGSLELVRLLVEHGAPVHARIKKTRRSVFAILAQSSDAATLQYLLDHGAHDDLDSSDRAGETPLTLAALDSNVEAVRLLLEKGANPNRADNVGETPLHQAVSGIITAMQAVESAVESQKANANRVTDVGKTAAVVAPPHEIRPDGATTIRLLVAHGAKWDVKDQLGRTPMETALAANCPAAVQALRQAGAPAPTPDQIQELKKAGTAK